MTYMRKNSILGRHEASKGNETNLETPGWTRPVFFQLGGPIGHFRVLIRERSHFIGEQPMATTQATVQTQPILRHIRSMLMAGQDDQPADAELLQRFLASRDEMAFTALYRRYGRLVWSVCGRILRSEQDREDAFQATFLFWRGRRRQSGGLVLSAVGFMEWPIEQP